MYSKFELNVVKVNHRKVTGESLVCWRRRKFYQLVYPAYVALEHNSKEYIVAAAAMMYTRCCNGTTTDCNRLVRSAVMIPSYNDTYGVLCTETNELFRCVSNIEQLERAITEGVVIAVDVKDFNSNIRGKTSHLGGSTLYVFDYDDLINDAHNSLPPYCDVKTMFRRDRFKQITDDTYLIVNETFRSIIRDYDFTNPIVSMEFVSKLSPLMSSPVMELVNPAGISQSIDYMMVGSEMVLDMIYMIFRCSFMALGADKAFIFNHEKHIIMLCTIGLIVLACQ